MKKIAEISNVSCFTIQNNKLVLMTSDPTNVRWKDEINCGVIVDEKSRISGFVKIGPYLAWSLAEFGEIFLYDDNGEYVNVLPEGCHLSRARVLANGNLYTPNRVTNTFWEITAELKLTDTELKLPDTEHSIEFDKCINGKYYRFKYPPNLITRINFDYSFKEIIWEINIRSYLGLSDLDSVDLMQDPFGYERLIYIPLRRGDLLAIDSQDSSLRWIFTRAYSGGFSIFENKIYKKNTSLFEIDALTGILKKERLLSDIAGREFYATGRILTYKDVIILWDSLNSEVLIINRLDFVLIACVKLEASGIANMENAVSWNNNRLYILDMDRRLQIFERN